MFMGYAVDVYGLYAIIPPTMTDHFPSMDRQQISRRQALIWLLIIWGVVYLWNLGGLEFKGEEARRALPAVEMLKSGNYIVPYIGGEPYYKKPPLINWLVAGSLKLCGVQNEFAARLPSVVFVLLFPLILLYIPGAWPDNNIRFMTGLIFMSCVGILEKGRLIEIEAVYVSLTGIATCWWLSTWLSQRPRWQIWLVPALALTAGMLTKGPAHLLFFFTVVLSVLIANRRLKDILVVESILCLIVIFGVTAWWYYLAQNQVDSTAMQQEINQQLSSRIFSLKYRLSENFSSFYRSLIGFLPWIIFLPVLWNQSLLQSMAPDHRMTCKSATLGLSIAVIFYLILPGSMSRYLMPAYPIASFMLAWLLNQQDIYGSVEQHWCAILKGSAPVIVISSILSLLAVVIHPGMDAWRNSLLWILIPALLTAGYLWRVRPRYSLVDLVTRFTLLIGFFVFLFNQLVPIWAPEHEQRRPLAQTINQMIASDDTLYVYRPGYLAFIYYLREPMQYLVQPEQINGNVHYLLIKDEAWTELSQSPVLVNRSPRIILNQEFRHKGNVLIVHLD